MTHVQVVASQPCCWEVKEFTAIENKNQELPGRKAVLKPARPVHHKTGMQFLGERARCSTVAACSRGPGSSPSTKTRPVPGSRWHISRCRPCWHFRAAITEGKPVLKCPHLYVLPGELPACSGTDFRWPQPPLRWNSRYFVAVGASASTYACRGMGLYTEFLD